MNHPLTIEARGHRSRQPADPTSIVIVSSPLTTRAFIWSGQRRQGLDHAKSEGFSLRLSTGQDIHAIANGINSRGGAIELEPTDMGGPPISTAGSGRLSIHDLVGARNYENTFAFMRDVAMRFANRVQLTNDRLSWYVAAVERAFGWNGVDSAQPVHPN